MNDKKIQEAYERLAFMHAATITELVATQRRMDAMSRSWWSMLKYRIKRKMGLIKDYE
jgi:hypothetical protein